ncbi:hypothetical protein DSCA_14640 [Desulfosarcina alkanivorans]|uniref:DUF2860 domain-containing protein n=1 Tax=Desulfosarcina alkanivorans TaxID=571177 RepID=A0A5K7YMF0_9BACT|nr:hypothetical protein DSCA_14640 [Desulfosarcina alkanivorans]
MITLVAMLACTAYALDPVPNESGFSGFIRAGAGVLKYESNMVAGNNLMDVGDETINSLTDEPDSETTGMGMFNFELAYTFASTRTQLTLGSQIEDIARLELGQQLAVKQELPDKSILSIGFLFSGIPTEVWEDPYLTDSARQETDRDSTGARLVYDRILGSSFEFRYSYRSIEIDNEESGLSPSLGLSPAERGLLRRDGDNHYLDLNYRFDFGDRHRLVSGITYFNEDRDGDAMSNSGMDFQLTYFFFNDPVTLVVNGLVGWADFDEDNPIYDKAREDDRYAAGVQYYYKNPFGWKPLGHEDFSVFASGSYLLEDADIDFYDTEVITALAGVLFRF